MIFIIYGGNCDQLLMIYFKWGFLVPLISKLKFGGWEISIGSSPKYRFNPDENVFNAYRFQRLDDCANNQRSGLVWDIILAYEKCLG
ncbi:MAG: hypothetical protein RH948_11700 [Cyclobacteriaceae bacterium]